MNLDILKRINSETLHAVDSILDLKCGRPFNVRVAEALGSDIDGNAVVRTIFESESGNGSHKAVDFFMCEFDDPRDLIEYLMLEIDCLPTYYWGATARHMWYCGYFAHGENPGCCWGYMHSMEHIFGQPETP